VDTPESTVGSSPSNSTLGTPFHGGRDPTVLLVRLFADQMTAAKVGGIETLPEKRRSDV
jgi:hypothetical protein